MDQEQNLSSSSHMSAESSDNADAGTEPAPSPPASVTAAENGAAGESRAATTLSVADKYGWPSSADFVRALSLPSQAAVDAALQRLDDESRRRGVSLDEVLALPASVLNRRQMDKVSRLQARQLRLLNDAIDGIVNLLGLAQVHKAQLEVKRVQDEWEREKRERRRSRRRRTAPNGRVAAAAAASAPNQDNAPGQSTS